MGQQTSALELQLSSKWLQEADRTPRQPNGPGGKCTWEVVVCSPRWGLGTKEPRDQNETPIIPCITSHKSPTYSKCRSVNMDKIWCDYCHDWSPRQNNDKSHYSALQWLQCKGAVQSKGLQGLSKEVTPNAAEMKQALVGQHAWRQKARYQKGLIEKRQNNCSPGWVLIIWLNNTGLSGLSTHRKWTSPVFTEVPERSERSLKVSSCTL